MGMGDLAFGANLVRLAPQAERARSTRIILVIYFVIAFLLTRVHARAGAAG